MISILSMQILKKGKDKHQNIEFSQAERKYVSCLATNFQQIQMRRELQIFTCSWDSLGTAVVDFYQLSIFNTDQHPFLKSKHQFE